MGEQPGNEEDLAGRPFIGPAGLMLDRALVEAGIDRAQVYVTNAVKHFKWLPRGKRRLHQKPNAAEISACHMWLVRELAVVRPKVVVCLGATAARSVLGYALPVLKERGKFIPLGKEMSALVTIHPSSLLRIPDEAERHDAYKAFVKDLSRISARLRLKD